MSYHTFHQIQQYYFVQEIMINDYEFCAVPAVTEIVPLSVKQIQKDIDLLKELKLEGTAVDKFIGYLENKQQELLGTSKKQKSKSAAKQSSKITDLFHSKEKVSSH